MSSGQDRVDIRAGNVITGDEVWLDGTLQEVLDVTHGRAMPDHVILSTSLADHQFPKDATLQVAHSEEDEST